MSEHPLFAVSDAINLAVEVWENEGGRCIESWDETVHSEAMNGVAIRAANSEPAEQAIAGANRPLTLGEVRKQIRRGESEWHRVAAPLSSLRVEGDRIIAGEQEFRLTEPGLVSMCGEINAPPRYINSLNADLRSLNLEYGLKTAGQRKRGLRDQNSLILVRDGEFRGLGRSDLHTLPGAEVISAVQDGLGSGLDGFRVENFTLCEESFALDVVSERMTAEVRAGDILQAGIHLEHALVGETATIVTAYVLRLVCKNGLTHRECIGSRKTKRTRRLSSDRENAAELQHAQIKGLVEQTCQRLEGNLQAIRNLRDDRFHAVPDVDRTFEQFLRRGRMYSQNLMQLLRRAWAEDLGGNRELTHFGVLNALTWLATHCRGVSDRQRTALSGLAGIFANQRVHICPACFSVVSGSGERVSAAG